MLELADAVVVGGGIFGAAITEALSRRFSRVLLVEAERCGSRATAGGFAWVNASSKWHDEAYHRLNAEACRRHIALAAEWDAGRTGWNGGGTLVWSALSDQPAFSALDSRIEVLQAWEYPISRVGRGDLQALEPHVHFSEDAVGLFAPSEGWVSTPRLIRFLCEQAREHHAEIAEFTEATGFTLDHQGAISSVETTRGRVSTRLLVLCAGVENGRLATLLRRDATPDHASFTRRSPGFLVETGPLPAGARVHRVCYPASASGLHLRPTTDGGVLIGADDTDALCETQTSAPHSEPVSAIPDPTSAASALVDRVAAVLPGLERDTPSAGRCCIRPIPSDGLPMVGELPGIAGAYLLASHSGVTLGLHLSQLLADEIITGRKSPSLADYRPSRVLRNE